MNLLAQSSLDNSDRSMRNWLRLCRYAEIYGEQKQYTSGGLSIDEHRRCESDAHARFCPEYTRISSPTLLDVLQYDVTFRLQIHLVCKQRNFATEDPVYISFATSNSLRERWSSADSTVLVRVSDLKTNAPVQQMCIYVQTVVRYGSANAERRYLHKYLFLHVLLTASCK